MDKDSKMSFWDHLDEFRSRLFIVLACIVVGFFIGYYYSQVIIQMLLEPSREYDMISFQVIKVTSMFMIQIGVSFFGGMVIGFPVMVYHLIRFLAPALKSGVMRLVLLVFFSILLFSAGILFAYHILIPFLLNFFTSISFNDMDVQYNFTLGAYINYVLWIIFISGIIFQLPIISIVGYRTGILTPEFLRHYRKHAFILFLIMSALITPPDPFSQILIFIPFVVLYEISIIVSKFYKK